MPRFSIKDLLLGITLVAVGIAVESMMGRIRLVVDERWSNMIIFCGGIAIIAAGVFAPFHRKKAGAVVGFVAALLFVLFTIRVG